MKCGPYSRHDRLTGRYSDRKPNPAHGLARLISNAHFPNDLAKKLSVCRFSASRPPVGNGLVTAREFDVFGARQVFAVVNVRSMEPE
jgi:hypothetical protein